jgi:hypothetical protein
VPSVGLVRSRPFDGTVALTIGCARFDLSPRRRRTFLRELRIEAPACEPIVARIASADLRASSAAIASAEFTESSLTEEIIPRRSASGAGTFRPLNKISMARAAHKSGQQVANRLGVRGRNVR